MESLCKERHDKNGIVSIKGAYRIKYFLLDVVLARDIGTLYFSFPFFSFPFCLLKLFFLYV